MRISDRVCAAALLATVLLPAPLGAQTPHDLPRVAVAVTAGAMQPLEVAVRDLYGGVFMPATIEADFRLTRRFFVFGSGQFLSQDGEVVFEVPPAPVEHIPLRVSTSSLRVGVGAWFPLARWVVSAAGGVSFMRCKEQWVGEDIEPATINTNGFVAQGGVEYRLSKWISAVGRVEYAYVPMDETRQLVPTFDLSGISLSGGVLVRF
jgi:hypothetical protein